MPTISGIAAGNAGRVGDREAIVDAHRRWTWSEVDADVAALAAALHALGVRKGDRVAILAPNSAEFILTTYAVLRLAAIVVPVNTRLAPPEVAHILGDSGASLLAYTGAVADVAHRAAARAKSVRLVSLGASPHHPDLLAGGYGPPVEQDRAVESDDAFILYTSGTTGKPKGVLLDHHRAIWAALSQIVSLGLRDGDRYLHLTPMYHSGGSIFLNVTTLLGGGHIVAAQFDPGAVLTTIERHRATLIFAVPTMFAQMLRLAGSADHDLSSWRVAVFGAAPMPGPTAEGLLNRFPGVSFFQLCGQTEAGPTGIYSTMEQVRSRPDSSGHLAQPFIESRVVGTDGTQTPPGEVGELVVRGDPVMKGYWGAARATGEAIRDGWLHTGDLVEVYDDGAMRLVDRLKDVIMSGGRNVYSAEVEQAIAEHAEVVDVAVISRPHPEWGETVLAVVNVADGAAVSEQDIKEHCRSRIADYKIPKEVYFGPVPRNSAGKVQKQLLRTEVERFGDRTADSGQSRQ